MTASILLHTRQSIKILNLEIKPAKKLGEKYDIKDFHDEV